MNAVFAGKTALGLIAICAACAMGAQSLSITPVPPWHETAPKAYAGDESSRASDGRLNVSLASADGDSFYRFAWTMSSSLGGPDSSIVFMVPNGSQTSYCEFSSSSKAGLCYEYVYLPKATSLNMGFYFAPGPPRSVEIRGFSVAKLASKDLEGNLLIDGDFESCGERPAIWTRRYKTKRTDMSIVPNPEFLAGKRCMAVDFKAESGNGEMGGIESVRLPVVLGREYELSLWAKAEKDFAIDVGVQAWSAFGHKGGHFYKNKDFKVSQGWKLLSMTVEVPSDISKYPDLADRTLSINIAGVKGEDETRVLFDNIALAPKAH